VGGVLTGGLVIGWRAVSARDGKQPSSYMPVDIHETFSVMADSARRAIRSTRGRGIKILPSGLKAWRPQIAV
jgi:hypothetical protein